MRATIRRRLAAAACALLAGSASAQVFVPIGPAPVSGFGGAAGRVAGVACSPTDPGLYYIATADGGVWRTRDGGASWTPLTDHLPTTATGAIALDPSNELVIYVGSGELSYANHSRYGLGLYKSTDGGDTWTVLAAQTFAGRSFGRILVHPTQPGVVYAAVGGAGGGPERFAAKGHPQRFGPTGVFKSVDGGVTWAHLTSGLPAIDATDLEFDPVDPQTLYAGIGYPYGSPDNGIYKTTDGGATWTLLIGGIAVAGGRVSLEVAASDRTRLYAFFAQPSTGIGVGGSSSGGGGQLSLMRSDNAGANWTTIPSVPNVLSAQGFYNNTVAVHPTDPNLAYFGGVTLMRTLDAGTTFQTGLPQHHPDVHASAWDASGRLVIGNDGGICRTLPGSGDTFEARNTGVGSLQFYAGFSTHPTNDTIMVGGLQDNGTVRRGSGSLQWTSVLGGDGGWTQIDQTNPTMVFSQFQGNNNLFRATNASGSNYARVGAGLSGRHAFLPPFLIDYNNPGRMLWANERIFESLNGGVNFTAISDDLTSGSPFAIRAMAMAPTDSSYVYVVTSDSRVHVSTDGGRTFTLVLTDALGWPRVTREITVDRLDPRTAYLAGARFGQPHVRRTRDAGATWETLDGDLPDLPVSVIEVDGRFPQPRLYAGADNGVYVSRDGGAHWTRYGTGMPNACVIDMKLEPTRPAPGSSGGGRLVVSTQGRSMWIVPVFCAADFNEDGAVDPDDLADYITCFFARPACDGADYSGDGHVNPDDLSDFITVFFSGGC